MKGVFSKALLKSVNGIGGVGGNNGNYNNVDKSIVKPPASKNGEFGKMLAKNFATQNTQPAANANVKTAVSVLAALNALLSIPILQRKDFDNLISGMDELERSKLVSMLAVKNEVKQKKSSGLGGLMYLLYLFIRGMISNFYKVLNEYNGGK